MKKANYERATTAVRWAMAATIISGIAMALLIGSEIRGPWRALWLLVTAGGAIAGWMSRTPESGDGGDGSTLARLLKRMAFWGGLFAAGGILSLIVLERETMDGDAAARGAREIICRGLGGGDCATASVVWIIGATLFGALYCAPLSLALGAAGRGLRRLLPERKPASETAAKPPQGRPLVPPAPLVEWLRDRDPAQFGRWMAGVLIAHWFVVTFFIGRAWYVPSAAVVFPFAMIVAVAAGDVALHGYTTARRLLTGGAGGAGIIAVFVGATAIWR